MSIREMSKDDLLDLATASIGRMRSEDYLETLMGLSGLRTVTYELVDRSQSGKNFLPNLPLSGLAEVIADAMWDASGNRIGGPRIAAEAVEAHLKATATTG